MIDDVANDAAVRSHDFTTSARHAGTRKRMALADQKAEEIMPIIVELRGQGIKSLRHLARALNDRGIYTRRGGRWHASGLKRMIDRAS